MFIRTQDLNAVINCNSFEIVKSILGGYYINNIYTKTGKTRFLGRYATKDRCQEITSEIERRILRNAKGVYEMPWE
ncbi:MAG: hypothetical protein PHV95_09145 [Eubacteriales bacterium]|nr:hypothetical protein [Eubacteriales bacterium]MDD4475933.1 hypothetical protein [Eubacteriales bacterium]